MTEWFTEQVIICDDRLKVLEELALTYSNLQKELQLLQEDKLRLNSLVGQLDKELTELTGQFTLTQSRIVAEEAACAEQNRLLQESLLRQMSYLATISGRLPGARIRLVSAISSEVLRWNGRIIRSGCNKSRITLPGRRPKGRGP